MNQITLEHNKNLMCVSMPSPETKILIDELSLNPHKPLIISDADEVIFELFTHMFAYFDENGYRFTGQSLIGFEIMDHMFNNQTDERIEADIFIKIITQFFAVHGDHMPMVENAFENLMTLSETCQIIILTNAPHDYRKRREEIYKGHGIHFPIISNIGNKLAAVNEIIKDHQAPIFFIDDSPEHHISIIENIPHIHCIHFIGDQKYAKLVSDVDNVHFKSSDWNDVRAFIEAQLRVS